MEKFEKNKENNGPHIEVIDDSTIEEIKTFSKAEIMEVIYLIAEEEGFKDNELRIENEYYDKDGNLIAMNIKIDAAAALLNDKINISYDFMIKGKHGIKGEYRDDAFTTFTAIVRHSEDMKDTHSHSGGIVAEFDGNSGKWDINPGFTNPGLSNLRKT